MESNASKGGCIEYVYNCFQSLKDSFKDYHAYASGYDSRQYQRQALDAAYESHYSPPMVTHSMDRLFNLYVPPSKRLKTLATNLADNVTHTFAYGAFAVANIIWTEKKYIEDFFEQNVCAKKSFEDNEGDKFYDAYDDNDNDILSRATYISQDGRQYPPLKRAMDDSWGFVNCDNLLVQFQNTNPRLPKRPIDDSWGFIDYDDLSLQFQNINSAPAPAPKKPPRRVMRLRK